MSKRIVLTCFSALLIAGFLSVFGAEAEAGVSGAERIARITPEATAVIRKRAGNRKPDLTIQDVQVLDASTGLPLKSFTTDKQIRIKCTVENRGVVAAGKFQVLFETVENPDHCFTTNIAGLGPGKKKKLNMRGRLFMKTPGETTWRVSVDHTDRIIESDTQNNVAVAKIMVMEPPPADLVIEDVKIVDTVSRKDLKEVDAGRKVSIRCTVNNAGEGDAGVFQVLFRTVENEDQRFSTTVSGLKAGKKKKINMRGRTYFRTTGQTTLRVSADTHDRIQEADETNNDTEVGITVRERPLRPRPRMDMAMVIEKLRALLPAKGILKDDKEAIKSEPAVEPAKAVVKLRAKPQTKIMISDALKELPPVARQPFGPPVPSKKKIAKQAEKVTVPAKKEAAVSVQKKITSPAKESISPEKPAAVEKPIAIKKSVVIEKPAAAKKIVVIKKPVSFEKPAAVKKTVITEKPVVAKKNLAEPASEKTVIQIKSAGISVKSRKKTPTKVVVREKSVEKKIEKPAAKKIEKKSPKAKLRVETRYGDGSKQEALFKGAAVTIMSGDRVIRSGITPYEINLPVNQFYRLTVKVPDTKIKTLGLTPYQLKEQNQEVGIPQEGWTEVFYYLT